MPNDSNICREKLTAYNTHIHETGTITNFQGLWPTTFWRISW